MGNTCCCCVTAREAVSKKKCRTVEPYSDDVAATVPEGGVNLDLIAIHPRIIAMGFPATGLEAWYRNPYEQVKDYLDLNHGASYRVYNLCAEAQHRYDPASRFDGRVREFPFWDHKPCNLSLIPDFIADADAYLAEDAKNVVAIHCKAGKGRTGLLGCCLMMAAEPRLVGDAATAVKEYGDIRTKNGKGLTHRSQIRYVEYWGRLQKEFGGRMPQGGGPVVTLKAITLVDLVAGASADAVSIQYVDAVTGAECTIVCNKADAKKTKPGDSDGVSAQWVEEKNGPVRVVVLLDEAAGGIRVKDDIRIELLKSGKSVVGAASVHTLFLEKTYGVAFIDKLYKRVAEFPADARMELDFSTE